MIDFDKYHKLIDSPKVEVLVPSMGILGFVVGTSVIGTTVMISVRSLKPDGLVVSWVDMDHITLRGDIARPIAEISPVTLYRLQYGGDR